MAEKFKDLLAIMLMLPFLLFCVICCAPILVLLVFNWAWERLDKIFNKICGDFGW